MARVLGWGRAFDDESQLLHVIEKFERAHTRMLDRQVEIFFWISFTSFLTVCFVADDTISEQFLLFLASSFI